MPKPPEIPIDEARFELNAGAEEAQCIDSDPHVALETAIRDVQRRLKRREWQEEQLRWIVQAAAAQGLMLHTWEILDAKTGEWQLYFDLPEGYGIASGDLDDVVNPLLEQLNGSGLGSQWNACVGALTYPDRLYVTGRVGAPPD